MYPFLHLGHFQLGTFGLLLWLAAVLATYVLYLNLQRNGVDADPLNVVALTVVAGILGAKLWHELENPLFFSYALRQIIAPGWKHPADVLFSFLHWFQAGFAWYGGLLAGIAVLLWQGTVAKPEGLTGWRAGIRMLDLAAPAACVGYGVGRIGCLLSGDGDYGINTTLPWGIHLRPDALVLPNPPNAAVQPTPVYELLFALAVAWLLWELGKRWRPVGWLTGLYLLLSGFGRFLVEFVRVNPKLYWGMSNAQIAAIGSMLLGLIIMLSARAPKSAPEPQLATDPQP